MDSAFHPVTWKINLSWRFTAPDTANCSAPFTVDFTDQTPGATSWLWDFGDGTTSTLQNPSHTYTTVGDFNVSLTVSTGIGCSNTFVKAPYVLIRPTTIRLNLPSGDCAPFNYVPVATITTVDPIASYLWDFGDGNTSTAATPVPHTYLTPGAYNVSLTVTTANGCTVTETVNRGVLVGTPGTPAFIANPTTTCAENIVSFFDQSTFTPGFEARWLWDFGDGFTDAEQNPTHQFEDTGAQVVRLTIYNNLCQTSTNSDHQCQASHCQI